MGYFDRFKKRNQPPASSPAPVSPSASNSGAGVPTPSEESKAASLLPVGPRLAEARNRLESKDLAGAMALYEEILAEAGDRADVLVAISGDLGTHGHLIEIVEMIAPRYDAQRHGPATGINVLQAYLGLRDADAARHVLDILFSLNRPDLEERLFGFSNAIAELMHDAGSAQARPTMLPPESVANEPGVTKISMISISKPIWFYGLEPIAAEVLPPKSGRLRSIAFAQLSLPALQDWETPARAPEHELTRLTRAIPLWLAEHLAFSPLYTSIAVTGVMDEPEHGRHYALFPNEWTIDQLKQLVSTNADPLDYVVTGALRQTAGDFELVLRLWEVKKFRERKQFHARWTPATADAELGSLLRAVSLFMEHQPYPAGQGVSYAPPRNPTARFETLAASLSLFLAEKKVLPTGALRVDDLLPGIAGRAADSAIDSLAWLTLSRRARSLGLAVDVPEPTLADDPLVGRARALGN
ncbi:hypothetical protein GALL_135750 [mine drainage metagenome]|uniref:Uncharacterized protein n=1 Tax=mine drainage metagenome TaxID=410659 RepID=A0A1J5S7U3_9ZZZZ